MYIQRSDYIDKIDKTFEVNPIVALLGPRQCGKTTLARSYAKQRPDVHYFDLEKPTDLARLEQPITTLEPLSGLIIIDEIQLRPDFFPILRVLIDEDRSRRQFLILGSASRDLIHQSSETLAGRISYLELAPFSYREVDHLMTLWSRGGFPNSYLAKNDLISYEWRQSYITTFLERDIPNLGIKIPAQTLRRFWMMLAHYHGQIFNASEIGKSLGVAHTTARHYLDILTGTFMIRELVPWIENIEKRQIKLPKIYFRDSGIFHALLGLADQNALNHHPKLGASWEGMAIEEIILQHQAVQGEVYFWGIHNQAELDLLILKNGKRLGFEVKYADAPRLSKSMTLARDTLNLDQLTVIYPGKVDYSLSEKIQVVGLENYLNLQPRT